MQKTQTQKIEPIVIIEDTREQTPLDFAPFAPHGIVVERHKLRTGDYTVKGFERQVFIERKAMSDAVSSLTHGRERLTREIYDRAAFATARLFVVEADWRALSAPYAFAPGANPRSIVNSLFSLMMPPVSMQVYCSSSRTRIAWFIAKFCAMFVHRATHGSAGMWRALFASDSADLAPFAQEGGAE